MICPKCGGDVKVIGCASNETVMFRQKKCKQCGLNFMTREQETDYKDLQMLYSIRHGKIPKHKKG